MGRSSCTCRSARITPQWNANRWMAVHLAVGMPANDRMDWLVEKATELGVASIQPLMTERSVLALVGRTRRQKSSPLAQCGDCSL
jgi:16S rRNA (uracil1498-N3)-methyltransferase